MLTIDLSGLDFHDSVHVSDLTLPEGCRPVGAKGDPTVVTIVPPTIMAEETPAAPAAATTAAAAPAAADAKAAAPAKGAAAPAAAAAPAKPAAKK